MYMSFIYATRCQPICTAKLVETFQDAFRKKKSVKMILKAWRSITYKHENKDRPSVRETNKR